VCQTALTGRRNSVPTAYDEVRPVLTKRALGHRTLSPASDGHCPVVRSFAYLSAHESGATLSASGDPAAGAYNPRPGVSLGQFLSSSRSPPRPSPNSPIRHRQPGSPFRRPRVLFPTTDPPRTSPSPPSSRVDPISRGFKGLGESFDPWPRGVRFNA
jgi:hypothetical protein